eukprot:365819-Chlamydomonas_euryale.AAC.9
MFTSERRVGVRCRQWAASDVCVRRSLLGRADGKQCPPFVVPFHTTVHATVHTIRHTTIHFPFTTVMARALVAVRDPPLMVQTQRCECRRTHSLFVCVLPRSAPVDDAHRRHRDPSLEHQPVSVQKGDGPFPAVVVHNRSAWKGQTPTAVMLQVLEAFEERGHEAVSAAGIGPVALWHP